MKAKIPTPICGQCIHFKIISKCSENEVTLMESNPMGQCTIAGQSRYCFVLKAYKSTGCDKYKGFGAIGGFNNANS